MQEKHNKEKKMQYYLMRFYSAEVTGVTLLQLWQEGEEEKRRGSRGKGKKKGRKKQ